MINFFEKGQFTPGDLKVVDEKIALILSKKLNRELGVPKIVDIDGKERYPALEGMFQKKGGNFFLQFSSEEKMYAPNTIFEGSCLIEVTNDQMAEVFFQMNLEWKCGEGSIAEMDMEEDEAVEDYYEEEGVENENNVETLRKILMPGGPSPKK